MLRHPPFPKVIPFTGTDVRLLCYLLATVYNLRMYTPCVNQIDHRDNRKICSRCGRLICTICNGGNHCSGNCVPLQDSSASGVGSDPMRLLLAGIEQQPHRILLYEEHENQLHDSLRMPDPSFRYYAFLRDVEPEDSRKVRNFHVVMECLDAAWFDQFADDLSGFPEWADCAQDASFRIVDLTVEKTYLREAVTKIDAGEPYFLVGNWLEVFLTYDPPEDSQFVTAVVYLPAQDETNPALAGSSGRETVGYVTSIRRVRPTQDGQRKLRLLESRIAGVEPEDL